MINEIERRSFWYEISKTQEIIHDEYGNPVICDDDIINFFEDKNIEKEPFEIQK